MALTRKEVKEWAAKVHKRVTNGYHRKVVATVTMADTMGYEIKFVNPNGVVQYWRVQDRAHTVSVGEQVEIVIKKVL